MHKHPHSRHDNGHGQHKGRLLNWPKSALIVATVVVVLLLVVAAVFAGIPYFRGEIATRNMDTSVTQAIGQHHVQILLSPENRKTALMRMLNNVRVIGMKDCTTPDDNSVLSLMGTQSFAYIWDNGGTGKNSPGCGLSGIVSHYGRPNTSVVITGTLDNPTESLLFYDHGIHKDISSTGSPKDNSRPTTVVPVPLSSLKTDPCANTTLDIVAHEDDDLLFMNPDLAHDIQSGTCVRTIYLTAGDSGNNKFYWLGRERGSQRAYAYMMPTGNILWVQQIIKLGGGQFIHMATPKDNPKVSLIFFRLPDGNLRGNGFADTQYDSLAKLYAGKITAIHSLDGQSAFTSDQLQAALLALMRYYHPDTIRAQSTQLSLNDDPYPDHSDHVTAGEYAVKAFNDYAGQQKSTLYQYHGYPIHGMPVNLNDNDVQAKTMIFLQYAPSDPSVCQSAEQCNQTATYGSYLQRMYKAAY